MTDPTRATYQGLTEAYDFFNQRLFGGRLPRCLITMQRQRGAYGYFAGKRFGTKDGSEITDEIALNPAHFKSRTTEETPQGSLPGGKETGQKVSHYIAGGGPFDKACRALIEQGFAVRYVELWSDPEKRKKKAASKTKYTCPDCGLNAWGKPEIHLVCGDCDERMEADGAGESDDA